MNWLRNIFLHPWANGSPYDLNQRKRLSILLTQLSNRNFEFSQKFYQTLAHLESCPFGEIKSDIYLAHSLCRIDLSLLTILQQLAKQIRLSPNYKILKKDLGEALKSAKQLKSFYRKEENHLKQLLSEKTEGDTSYKSLIVNRLNHTLKELDNTVNTNLNTLRKWEQNYSNYLQSMQSVSDGKMTVYIISKSEKLLPGSAAMEGWLDVFDSNYLVARAFIKKHQGDGIVHTLGMDSLVAYNGYIRRAFLILLRKKAIKEWVTSSSLSKDVLNAIKDISAEPDVYTHLDINNCWHIRLK